MDMILALLGTAKDFLASHGGSIATAGAFVWVFIAKLVPGDKAGKIVGAMQSGLDLASKGFTMLGDLLHSVSDLLAHIVKSDGFLGSK